MKPQDAQNNKLLTILTKILFSPLSRGFTLIELMIAVFISALIIAGASFILINTLEQNSKAQQASSNRIYLNRALNFMADEVRRARSINLASVPTAAIPVSPIIDPAVTPQAVLVLDIPGLSESVVYHLAKPHSSQPWTGPRVIYRWGPAIDVVNFYSNPSNPGAWVNQPLIDGISDATPPNDPCSGLSWTYFPSTSRKGFFTCVDTNNLIAQIYIEKKPIETTTTTGGEILSVTTKVYARID
jgi:prepilin-type N-terminal cleavage/methylation domain-containing protein